MIKNIYSQVNKFYEHEYYCDNCFTQIRYGEIHRNELAVKCDKFDLCSRCKVEWDDKLEKLREV